MDGFIKYDPLKILNDEIAARKQQIARTTAKYTSLKKELIQQINDLRDQTEKEKEDMKKNTEDQIKSITDEFNARIEKMKKDSAERIYNVKESITPDYTTENKIENITQQIQTLQTETENKTKFLEESTQNELNSIESESSKLKKRSDRLSRKINQLESINITDSPVKNEKIKEINKRMKQLSADAQSYQVALNIRAQKYDKSEKNTREYLQYELSKLRRQIKEGKQKIETQISLISNSQMDHSDRIKRLKKEIFSLTTSQISSKSPKTRVIKRIPEKIVFFESAIRNNKVLLNERKEKLRKLQERNKVLSFQIRKLRFQLSSFD